MAQSPVDPAPARVVLLPGSLERLTDATEFLLTRGWSPRVAVSISEATETLGESAPQILAVRFGVEGPRVAGEGCSTAERGMLRRVAFVATVAENDAEATATAFAEGALQVIATKASPESLEAHLVRSLAQLLAAQEADRRAARLELMLGHSNTGFWEFDLEHGEVWCSDLAAQLLSIDDSLETRPWERWIEVFPTDRRNALSEWIGALAKDIAVPTFEHTLIGVAGTPYRLRHIGKASFDEAGRCHRITVMLEALGARLGESASGDRGSSSRLLDTAHFLHRVERAIRTAGRSGQHVAVLYLDVHRVRSLTAGNLSSDAGELLLAAIADRVRDGIRDTDALAHPLSPDEGIAIARWGGDHFTILLPDLPRMHEAAKIGARILELLSQPFTIAGCELCVPASIGIAGFPTDHHAADELVRRAETASYCARQDGHASMKFYSAALDAKAFERLTLETSLRRALDRNELIVYYQPRVDVRTERIEGFEALLRWKHPDLGFVSPGQFIPLAEETGLIVPIGEWVLREACRQNKEWQDAGIPPVRMAVNLSTVQFTQASLQESVRAALESAKLDAKWLELELTESTVMRDASAAVATLTRLKSAGVHLSIDDFGTGYSSLAYLKRFPIDALKIDQSFVRDVTTNPDDSAIVTSILLMARSLKLGVVAEGVETESQLSFLRILQCDEAQGYLFSPPVPPDRARVLLEQGVGRRRAA